MLISSRPSTYVKGSNVNLRSFGVTGVKRSFSIKLLYNSSMLHCMTTEDSSLCQRLGLTRSVRNKPQAPKVRESAGGERRVKRVFRRRRKRFCFHLFIMRALTHKKLSLGKRLWRLIHVDHLETISVMGSNVNPGSFGVTLGGDCVQICFQI